MTKRNRSSVMNTSILILLFLYQQVDPRHNRWFMVATTAAFLIQSPQNLRSPPSISSNDNQIQPQNTFLRHRKSTSSQLYDISEWRDQFFTNIPDEVDVAIIDTIAATGGNVSIDRNDNPVREICVLPFPLDDVLLQGETKELCLYEKRFHQLFEKSNNDHNSVVAMGLLAPPAGILQNMPICEIENYRVMEGKTEFGTDFSILVTIRVVGRGSLLHIQDEDIGIEYLTGWCMEVSDEVARSNDDESKRDIIDVGNRLVDKIDKMVYSIQTIETSLNLESSTSPLPSSSSSNLEDGVVVSEATMARRILEAELEEEYNEEDDDDDEEEEEDANDRRSRLERAFKVAKSTDSQGYTITNSDLPNVRSIQDLTALSWAYFCCENDAMDIISYRLRAIESTNLIDRLNLALSMMIERKTQLNILQNKGRNAGNGDDDDDEDLMLD